MKSPFKDIFKILNNNYFFNIFKNNFYMIIKRASNGKIHYILPVCNMTCLNLVSFAYPLRRRRLVLGRSVELRTPLEGLFNFFFNFCFLTVYVHIFKI